jgi:hypothetical protein
MRDAIPEFQVRAEILQHRLSEGGQSGVVGRDWASGGTASARARAALSTQLAALLPSEQGQVRRSA